MTPASRTTDVHGVRVHYYDEGAGDPPYVLIHGWGSSVLKWRDAVPRLMQDRRTIAIDIPGFGRSECPDGSYSPGWMAGAVRATLDEIGVKRAILVGNSLGGLVAIYAAAAWPDRVAGLVLAAPALPNEQKVEDPVMFFKFLAPGLPVVGEFAYAKYLAARTPEDLVAEGLQRNCADPTRVSRATLDMLVEEAAGRVGRNDHIRAVVRANRHMMWALTARRERTWRILRSIEAPTMFLWGDSDKLLPTHIGERAVGELSGSQLVMLPDCGHNPQMELPDEFSAATITFARSAIV